MFKTFLRILAVVAGLAVIAIAVYAEYVFIGLRSAAPVSGTLHAPGVRKPVVIYRDRRGVPHIRAQDEHDLFFADGFVQGSDRLFQLDLMRRYAYGTLSEVFGKPALKTDERQRTVPVAEIVDRQYREMPAHERAILQAFAAGVNFAMRHEPKPTEFRLLFYSAPPWRPQDSLAVDFSVHVSLADSWNSIARRIGRNLPLTDPCFDAPVMRGLHGIAHSARCLRTRGDSVLLRELRHPMPVLPGSNAWAAGADRTTTGRALLANDPHLGLMIPGIWYLIDLKAPGYHVAGAALPGTPGVILGHNDYLAWGVTNADTTSLSVYDAPRRLPPKGWKTETFHVRLGGAVTRRYYRTRTLFGAHVTLPDGKRRFVLVRWPAYADPASPWETFDRLDRARSVQAALHVLKSYPGPPLDFVLADTGGRAAYQLAGKIPDDPLWARGFHPASDLARAYPVLPSSALPDVAPSRRAVVWSASNKMYGPGYPYRLSARFTPPYRAYRIAELLRAVRRYSPNYFARMQMDVVSIPELVLARSHKALRGWNGAFTPSSRDATLAYRLRTSLSAAPPPDGRVTASGSKVEPWGVAGAVTVRHPLAAVGLLNFLNGTTFPGDGDSYTIHLQRKGYSQSFRAVWDVGRWNAGGISIPQGESGEQGSGHYTDEARAWVRGRLLALPYSDAAVRRAAVNRLTLLP